jgi:DNA invertase Pin-like site-specific DNA recombinase
MLKGLGIDLIPASAPDFFVEDTPTAVLVRQVLGAIAQFEKASLVAKLKAARDRKRARDGKCEGRRSHREMNPELVALAKRLHRRNPKTRERAVPYRNILTEWSIGAVARSMSRVSDDRSAAYWDLRH